MEQIHPSFHRAMKRARISREAQAPSFMDYFFWTVLYGTLALPILGILRVICQP
jgi:hypothetical protein